MELIYQKMAEEVFRLEIQHDADRALAVGVNEEGAEPFGMGMRKNLRRLLLMLPLASITK